MSGPAPILTRANLTLAYLAAVLLLGGASAAGFSGNLALQIGGALLIGATLQDRKAGAPAPSSLGPFAVAVAVLALVQFVPLPPLLWSHLPGRGAVAEGFTLLGAPLPWLHGSLAPWKSLASLAWAIPALALFVALRAGDAPRTRAVIGTIALVAFVSTLIGVMQKGAGQGYFYAVTNYGQGPGFFANSNHQGGFLLSALALVGGYLASLGPAPARRSPEWLLQRGLPLALGAALALGVLLSGSLACLLLAPVLAGVVLINRPGWHASGRVLALALAGFVVAAVAFLLFVPMSNDLATTGVTPGISRREFLATGAVILRDFAPFGSGLGTFQDIYRWYEVPARVGQTYVNHAHDDLLELLIETGLFGLAAAGLFLAWFVPRGWRAWTAADGAPIARAAALVIAVILAHSLVDYPLRTAAMSGIMAVACALLLRPAEDLRPRRPRRRMADETKELIRI